MDKKYQDIHICNHRNKEEIVYRQTQIEKIRFSAEIIFIEYKDHNGIDITLSIPKLPNMTITID